MPTPPSASKNLADILTSFKQQYVAATVRQEELLRSMLDVQKDFRNECAAVAIRQEAMLTTVLDNQTSLLEAELPDMTLQNGVNQIRKLGKEENCSGPQPNRLQQSLPQLNLPVCSAPLANVLSGDIGSTPTQQDADHQDVHAPKFRASSAESEGIPIKKPVTIEERRSERRSAARVTAVNQKKLRTTYLTQELVADGEAEEQAGDLARIIQHSYFKGVIYAVILINASVMGLQIDFNGGSWDTLWEVLDKMCTAVFIIEAIIKMCCLRSAYFLNRWDLLDFFIVCSAIADFFMSASYLAIFQILRLARLVKILKMKRDLMLLIGGIFASLRAMFWVCVLMALIIYTGAILCVEVIRDEDGYQSYGFDNDQYFGDLGSSMLTLFSIAILDYWYEVVWPVSKVQPFMLAFFGFFLVISSFGLMNALIGIVVERTTEAANTAKELGEELVREHKLQIAYDLVELVHVMDDSHDGLITAEELDKVKDTEGFKNLMVQFDFPPGFSLSDLNLILDDNGNGEMSTHEFIDGIFKLIFCCSDFHKECMAKLSFAQIKQDIFKLRRDIFKELKTMRNQFHDQEDLKLAP